MEKKITHSRFFTLLKQIPNASKEELVWNYSNMLTSSLREFSALNPKGYEHMIEDMQAIVDGISNNELKRLRSNILLRIQKHGVDTTNWNEVNRFLSNKRIAGKELYKLSVEELRALVPKLEQILRKDSQINQQIQRLACLN